MCHSESRSKLPYPYIFTAGIYRKESLVWFEAPSLLHHQCWALIGTLPGHGIAALSCGNPVALGPQEWIPSPPPCSSRSQMGCWVGQHIVLFLCLGTCRCGQPAISLFFSPQGQFSGFHVPRFGSPTAGPLAPALLCCPSGLL